MGSSPPATAAADLPDDPPAVRPCCQGLWVTPCSRQADVEPAELAGRRLAHLHHPRRLEPADHGGAVVGDPVGEHQAGVAGGPPLDPLEPLTPMGTPPKGRVRSGAVAAALAPSASTNGSALRRLASTAAHGLQLVGRLPP